MEQRIKNKCFFLHLKSLLFNWRYVFYVDVHITDISDYVVKAFTIWDRSGIVLTMVLAIFR